MEEERGESRMSPPACGAAGARVKGSRSTEQSEPATNLIATPMRGKLGVAGLGSRGSSAPSRASLVRRLCLSPRRSFRRLLPAFVDPRLRSNSLPLHLRWFPGLPAGLSGAARPTPRLRRDGDGWVLKLKALLCATEPTPIVARDSVPFLAPFVRARPTRQTVPSRRPKANPTDHEE